MKFFTLVLLFTLAVSSWAKIRQDTVVHGDCTVRQIDDLLLDLYDPLKQLLADKSLRYFRCSLDQECSLWETEGQCTQQGSCEVNSIPATVDWSSIGAFEEPHRWWRADPVSESIDVDLVKTPEGNTGYAGQDTMKVWSRMYSTAPKQGPTLTLLSGIHSTISMHIVHNSMPCGDSLVCRIRGTRYIADLDGFERRVLPHDDRTKNLYHSFLFVYSAVRSRPELLAPYLPNGAFDVIAPLHACKPTYKLSSSEKESMRQFLWELGPILDCVGCEKCKTWSKVHFMGLATAGRILSGEATSITKNEAVALMNLLGSLASSLHHYESLSIALKVRDYGQWAMIGLASVGVCAILRALVNYLSSQKAKQHLD